jgi:hypothetical protein
MKINEYYRDTANLNLNGSIAALVPAIILVAGNLFFIKNKEIMILIIPFLIYSLLCFQLYLFRMKQSLSIDRNLMKSERNFQSLFEARHLLVLFLNTKFSRLLLYFPDGHLAGRIERFYGNNLKKLSLSKIFALYNLDNDAIGYFKVSGRKIIKIDVSDHNRQYLGRFEKRKLDWRTKKRKLLDSKGRYIGAIEGSFTFMDEQILTSNPLPDGRLRRGWMPIEWSPLFPEPNTPILSLRETLSEQDKLLRMSFIINEYFIER